MTAIDTRPDIDKIQLKIRLLLALCNSGAAEHELKKSEFTKQVVRAVDKYGDCEDLLEELEKAGAIANHSKPKPNNQPNLKLQVNHNKLKSSKQHHMCG